MAQVQFTFFIFCCSEQRVIVIGSIIRAFNLKFARVKANLGGIRIQDLFDDPENNNLEESLLYLFYQQPEALGNSRCAV
jgi:hypothetical protein